jgi:hypothetical protein
MNDRKDVEWSKIEMPTPVTPVTPVGEEEAPSVIADQAIKPETASATPVTPVEETQGDDVRTLLARAQSRMRRTWIPPDIVRHNRPSLLRVIAYAWRGDWGPKKGAWRTAGKIYSALLGIEIVAFGYMIAWIGERPARLFAGGLLGVAIVGTLKSLGWL